MVQNGPHSLSSEKGRNIVILPERRPAVKEYISLVIEVCRREGSTTEQLGFEGGHESSYPMSLVAFREVVIQSSKGLDSERG